MVTLQNKTIYLANDLFTQNPFLFQNSKSLKNYCKHFTIYYKATILDYFIYFLQNYS